VGDGDIDVGNKTRNRKAGSPAIERLAKPDSSSRCVREFAAPCCSNAPTAAGATNRPLKNSCNWWAAATSKPGMNRGAGAPLRRSSGKPGIPH
jgi:hypothetical protein